jgi:hypothetical protein
MRPVWIARPRPDHHRLKASLRSLDQQISRPFEPGSHSPPPSAAGPGAGRSSGHCPRPVRHALPGRRGPAAGRRRTLALATQPAHRAVPSRLQKGPKGRCTLHGGPSTRPAFSSPPSLTGALAPSVPSTVTGADRPDMRPPQRKLNAPVSDAERRLGVRSPRYFSITRRDAWSTLAGKPGGSRRGVHVDERIGSALRTFGASRARIRGQAGCSPASASSSAPAGPGAAALALHCWQRLPGGTARGRASGCQAHAVNWPPGASHVPQGPSFSPPFPNFLLSLLTPLSVTAFPFLPLPPFHDLVLPVATMTYSRADHCITNDHGRLSGR